MKYLKLFGETLDESSSNESNTDDVLQIVKDILLPIYDMGYDVSVNHYILNGDTNQLIIRVVSWGDEPLYITDEVKEEFIRMKDYLESEGYDSITAKFYLEDRIKDEKDINDFLDIHTVEKDVDFFLTGIPFVKEPIVNLLIEAKKKL